MFTQKKYDIISCLFCIGLGITFLIGSFKYGGIHSGIPNAGLFPFLSALILILLPDFRQFMKNTLSLQ
jgi:hypothetical protein